MAKNIEGKMLSYQEFIDVAALSESFRQYDEKRKDLLITFPESKYKGMTVQEYLEEAESIGIPEEYFLKAIKTLAPSIEEQLKEIKEHNGIPSMRLIFETYYNTIKKKLEGILSQKFIVNANRSYNSYSSLTNLKFDFHKIVETEKVEKKGLIFKKEIKTKINKKNLLAELFFSTQNRFTPEGKFSLDISLKDPLFLHIFGEYIKKLNSYYKKRGLLNYYKVNYNYDNNIDEVEFGMANGEE